MSNHEFAPPARHHGYIDPAQIQKIKEGGKKADAIRKKAEELHQKEDVPQAESMLEEALKKIEKNSPNPPSA